MIAMTVFRCGVVRTVLVALSVLLGFVGAHAAEPASGSARDLSGVWWSSTIPTALKATESTDIPLTASGRKLYERTRVTTREIAAGPKNKRDMARCEPAGVPRIWVQPFPFKIVQKGDVVTILYEHNRVFRRIRMDAALPTAEDADPAYMGHSVGHWQGDELVIDTVLFKDKTVLDDAGLPHSDQLRVTERLRKQNDGKSLSVNVTINDPAVYSKPWSTGFVFPRAPDDIQLEEYICGWGQFENRLTRAAGSH